MSPVYDTDADAAEARGKGKVQKPEFPGDGASDPQRERWLEWAFSVPKGSRVGEVIRYGADDVTPMTVEVVPPGNGKPRIVRFEEERQAANHGTLRRALVRDGDLRAEHITSAKVAGDAYYLLCKLARVVGSNDPQDKVREWCDGYREDAERHACSLAKGDLHETLDRLRRYPYSKRQINLWLAAQERGEFAQEPRPPLFEDSKGGEWTSITHLATYIRWGRDQPGVIDNTALSGLVVELGGEKWVAQGWDATTRQRQHKITTVLVRLPPVDEERGE